MVIDGENVNTAYPDVVWRNVPGTDTGDQSPLVTAYFAISSGTHTISTLQEDATFMCIVYGAGDRESYAYMGGMRLQVNISFLSHLILNCCSYLRSSKR